MVLRFQLDSLFFILAAGFMVFVIKNRNLSKGNTLVSAVWTPFTLPGQAVRATLEKLQVFRGLTLFSS